MKSVHKYAEYAEYAYVYVMIFFAHICTPQSALASGSRSSQWGTPVVVCPTGTPGPALSASYSLSLPPCLPGTQKRALCGGHAMVTHHDSSCESQQGDSLAMLFKTHFKRNLSLLTQIVEPATVMSRVGSINLTHHLLGAKHGSKVCDFGHKKRSKKRSWMLSKSHCLAF